MFNLSFVVITVRSRLIGFDRSLEEAAQDLGATPWETFRLVTLPLIMPGVLSAGLLAFALSIDDFVITNFNSGSTITFPLFIWGAARVAVPPQIYVIATMIFLVTVAVMLAHRVAAAPRGEDGRGAAGRAGAGAGAGARLTLDELIAREREAVRAPEPALARAARGGAREPPGRRADVLDDDVAGRLPALPGARVRRDDRGRRRSRVRRLLPRRHRRDGGPLARADDARDQRHRGHHHDAAHRGRRVGRRASWRAASACRTGSSRSPPRTRTAG